jgi:hypothetical protein
VDQRGHQLDIHRLDALAGDQPAAKRRPEAVTKSKPPSFIRATISSEVFAVLTLTLNSQCLFLERGDPVEGLVGLAALDIARPRQRC